MLLQRRMLLQARSSLPFSLLLLGDQERMRRMQCRRCSSTGLLLGCQCCYSLQWGSTACCFGVRLDLLSGSRLLRGARRNYEPKLNKRTFIEAAAGTKINEKGPRMPFFSTLNLLLGYNVRHYLQVWDCTEFWKSESCQRKVAIHDSTKRNAMLNFFTNWSSWKNLKEISKF